MFRTDPDQRLETAVLGALDQDDLASKAERALTKGEASEHSTSDAPEIGKAGFSDFRKSGFSEIRKSGNPDFRIPGNPDFRKSDF